MLRLQFAARLDADCNALSPIFLHHILAHFTELEAGFITIRLLSVFQDLYKDKGCLLVRSLRAGYHGLRNVEVRVLVQH